MHEHIGCEHDLKHCTVCDVVYCIKCKEEWKKQVWTFSYPPYQTITDENTYSIIYKTCGHFGKHY